jgi:hypothetical protein
MVVRGASRSCYRDRRVVMETAHRGGEGVVSVANMSCPVCGGRVIAEGKGVILYPVRADGAIDFARGDPYCDSQYPLTARCEDCLLPFQVWGGHVWVNSAEKQQG